MDLSKSSYLSLAIDLSKSSYHSRWISQKSSYLLKTGFIKGELSTLRKGFIKDKIINRRIPAYAFSQISLFLAYLLSNFKKKSNFITRDFPRGNPPEKAQKKINVMMLGGWFIIRLTQLPKPWQKSNVMMLGGWFINQRIPLPKPWLIILVMGARYQ